MVEPAAQVDAGHAALAGEAAHRPASELDPAGEPAGIRSGTGGDPPEHPSRQSVRLRDMDSQSGGAARIGVNPATTRKATEGGGMKVCDKKKNVPFSAPLSVTIVHSQRSSASTKST